MAPIDVLNEHEIPNGWSFTVRVRHPHAERLHTVTLSWADHEHWTHGAISPQRTARAVVRAALEALPDDEPPERFDAARLSHQIKDFTQKLARALARDDS